MHIEEIIINHYKSIKDPIYLRDLFGFHILVGPNNAGKTNILDAINLFFDKDLETERFFDRDTDIQITLNIEGKRHKIRYGESEEKDSIFSKAEKSFVRINDTIDYPLVAKRINIFKENHPHEYKMFSSTLEKYFKEVEITEELFLLNILADEKSRSMKRMGEGFKRLFVILFYLFHPQYRVILIDEPETHLHPSVIKRFLQILEKGSLKKQIFLTTHHPTFVQARYLPFIWRITRNKNKSTAVYGFNTKNIDLNRLVQEINDENSGILFADKVLLVEGVSDAIFMREMINKFYKNDKDIKVVYTSGKGSVDLYATICEVFNIPHSIMLDNDAINSSSLQKIKKFPKFNKKTSLQEKIKRLKEEEIFILENDLEQIYPVKYKKREKKPLTALYVSQQITKEDLNTEEMRIIKELLEAI